MITEDELKKYLPKYLSEENYKTLLAELKSFPYNIDGRMYTSMLDKNVIFQGDGLKKMPIIDLIYNIIFKETDPDKLASFLITKD